MRLSRSAARELQVRLGGEGALGAAAAHRSSAPPSGGSDPPLDCCPRKRRPSARGVAGQILAMGDPIYKPNTHLVI
jgi:hypothetical protein